MSQITKRDGEEIGPNASLHIVRPWNNIWVEKDKEIRRLTRKGQGFMDSVIG
ncbi:MAG: hypothetical protein ABID54_14350 [Pseudomonadota bacterium]